MRGPFWGLLQPLLLLCCINSAQVSDWMHQPSGVTKRWDVQKSNQVLIKSRSVNRQSPCICFTTQRVLISVRKVQSGAYKKTYRTLRHSLVSLKCEYSSHNRERTLSSRWWTWTCQLHTNNTTFPSEKQLCSRCLGNQEFSANISFCDRFRYTCWSNKAHH